MVEFHLDAGTGNIIHKTCIFWLRYSGSESKIEYLYTAISSTYPQRGKYSN